MTITADPLAVLTNEYGTEWKVWRPGGTEFLSPVPGLSTRKQKLAEPNPARLPARRECLMSSSWGR